MTRSCRSLVAYKAGLRRCLSQLHTDTSHSFRDRYDGPRSPQVNLDPRIHDAERGRFICLCDVWTSSYLLLGFPRPSGLAVGNIFLSTVIRTLRTAELEFQIFKLQKLSVPTLTACRLNSIRSSWW